MPRDPQHHLEAVDKAARHRLPSVIHGRKQKLAVFGGKVTTSHLHDAILPTAALASGASSKLHRVRDEVAQFCEMAVYSRFSNYFIVFAMCPQLVPCNHHCSAALCC
ncbi:uncharacterized protein [Physcomitrium patens]|uniref:uncharacterized protein n=1 Tax=Physcomitrium patens TaxID=3218 RepID=UPI003CCDFA2A